MLQKTCKSRDLLNNKQSCKGLLAMNLCTKAVKQFIFFVFSVSSKPAGLKYEHRGQKCLSVKFH